MQLVLSGLQWLKAVLYLDEIITFGKTFDETLLNLELVFERLHKAGLVLRPSKCKLFQESVEFLGHVVSQEGYLVIPTNLRQSKTGQNQVICYNSSTLECFDKEECKVHI